MGRVPERIIMKPNGWMAIPMLRRYNTVLTAESDSILGRLEEIDECLMNIATKVGRKL